MTPFFKERGVIGLCGIDTRALTKVIRESGVMNGMITTELTHVDMDKIHSYRVTNAVESTSVTEMTRRENPEKTCTVALMDYGYKENIRRELEKRGAEVIVCPYNTTADELKALNIDGVMLSNGPGDPADNIEVIENLKKIMNMGKPLFGICSVTSCWRLQTALRPKSSSTVTAAQTSRCRTSRPAASTSPARTMLRGRVLHNRPRDCRRIFQQRKRQNVRGRAL